MKAKWKTICGRRCKNSLTGEHKNISKVGKNAAKMDICVYCNQPLHQATEHRRK